MLGFGDDFTGDAVIRDVKEPGVFGGVFDLQGERSAGGEGEAVDGAEVYKGNFRGVGFAWRGGGDGAVDGLEMDG